LETALWSWTFSYGNVSDPRCCPLQTLEKTRGWRVVRHTRTLDELNWNLNQSATRFAHELLDAQPEILEEGLENLPLKSTLIPDWEITGTNLVTRKGTRDFNAVRNETTKNILVCGQAESGKSRNLQYLHKLLLQSNALVIFQHSPSNRVFAFVPSKVPKQGSYEVYSVKLISSDTHLIGALNNPKAWHLFDPKEKDRDEPPFVAARCVVVSSPTPVHSYQLRKSSNYVIYYVPPLSVAELLAARKCIVQASPSE